MHLRCVSLPTCKRSTAETAASVFVLCFIPEFCSASSDSFHSTRSVSVRVPQMTALMVIKQTPAGDFLRSLWYSVDSITFDVFLPCMDHGAAALTLICEGRFSHLRGVSC